MTASEADPPEDVPKELIAVLQNSGDSQLREVINYAQQLLREHSPITDAVESRHGEELVRVEDHGAYTIAIVVRPPVKHAGHSHTGSDGSPMSRMRGADTSGTTSGKSMLIRGLAEMTEPLFSRVVVPVANRDDAAATATTLRSYVVMDATMIAVHVIEKAGGAPDKASVEQREQRAAEIFSIITGEFDDSGVVLETDLRYGTDIASSIVGAAHDRSASAIVFIPRGGSRWHKLLTGDVTHNLVRSSGIPILVLPDRDESEICCNQNIVTKP